MSKHRTGLGGAGRTVTLQGVVGEGPSEKVTFEQRSAESQWVSLQV